VVASSVLLLQTVHCGPLPVGSVFMIEASEVLDIQAQMLVSYVKYQ
jgi:hypothetical protein